VPGESFDRRTVLGALAGAGAASLAGCSLFQSGSDADTTPVPADEARELAVRFAPTLYFDRDEEWFPTDPRRYTSQRDGETVVDGFDAFNGYIERREQDDVAAPPDPTAFYNAVSYDGSPLTVVQFWFYAVFDQFTTNFHWHDWEVLHVFVDQEADAPVLYVASSHSTKVPNNEFLDPPERTPRILSELGSHSSALSLNADADGFQRLALDGNLADITNSALGAVERLGDLPIAYGLPRDEGARLPYLVPELDGAPVYEHPDLPAVGREDLVPEELTVASFDALASPPSDLPARESGVVFRNAEGGSDDGSGGGGDGATVEYELVATGEVESITEFTGPQLSFQFAVPEFAEDAIAGHITATGTPWDQPRYENPAADITDPGHRAALADRYDAIGEPAAVNAVVAGVSQAVTDDDAPENAGVTTQAAPVEAVALLESDPAAVPTFRGVAVVNDVPAGEHRLTVNGAGFAPHSERLRVRDSGTTPTETPTADDASAPTDTPTGTRDTTDATAAEGDDPPTADFAATPAGVGGEVPLVAREDAQKLQVDTEGTDADLRALAVEDDFGGRLYETRLGGREAVYVHAGGAYTTEVRDADDEIGAFRVNPDPDTDAALRIDRPDTGKGSLAGYLADVAAETAADVADAADTDISLDGTTDAVTGGSTATPTPTPTADGPGGGRSDDDTPGGTGGPGNAVAGLARALDAVATAARRAAERAEAGDRNGADRQLRGVTNGLETVASRLEAARSGLPGATARATDNRLSQARKRARQARDADRL
jgi:hypothetical protein